MSGTNIATFSLAKNGRERLTKQKKCVLNGIPDRSFLSQKCGTTIICGIHNPISFKTNIFRLPKVVEHELAVHRKFTFEPATMKVVEHVNMDPA